MSGRSSKARLFTALILIGSAACSDRITNPPAIQRAVVERGGDLAAIDRFGVTFEISGALKPGSTINVAVRVTGNFDSDADVQIVFPEAALSELSRTRSTKLLHNVGLPAHASRRESLARGNSLDVQSAISFSEPGYYRVIATAVDVNAPALLGATPVQNIVVAERWLWIDERGGRVTETFDATLFPDSTIPVPGPLKQHPKNRIGTNSDAGASMNYDDICIEGYVQYVRTDSLNAVAPVSEIRGDVAFVDKSNSSSATIYTDQNGYFSICRLGSLTAYFDIAWYHSSQGTVTEYGANHFARTIGTGSLNALSISNERSNIHRLIHGAAKTGLQMFQLSAPEILWRMHAAADSTSYYSHRMVNMKDSHAWGEFGLFATAHEYGHFVMLDPAMLNTFWVGDPCGPTHTYYQLQGWACAGSEGLANFYAALVR